MALEKTHIPWEKIRTEWRIRELDALTEAVSGPEGLAADHMKRLDHLLFPVESRAPEELVRPARESDLEKSRAEETLTKALGAVAPDDKALLAFYLYGRCLEKWEQSEDYRRIRTVLHALRDVSEQRRPRDAPSDAGALLFSLIVSQAQLVDDAMAVEQAMNCSCPVATSQRAGRLVKTLTPLVAELDGMPTEGFSPGTNLAELRELVRSDAAAQLCYFENIAEVAGTVLAFAYPDAAAPTDVYGVLERLAQAERGSALEGDVYQSELRAHRTSLKALADRVKKPRLLIDEAELVYVYPFALEGIEAEAAVQLLLRDGFVPEAAGFPRLKVGELELNDIWERPHVPKEERYSGASIQLPSFTVTTTAHEFLGPDAHARTRVLFDAEVRLSRLGNHYVRIASRLEDAGPHDVNQALRRGSHGMGAETLTFEGHAGEPWAKVPAYADDVIKAIVSALNAQRDAERRPLVSRVADATFHVALTAGSISVQHPDRSTSPATLADLKTAVGASLLFHPIRHLATSLEEWVRYPAPEVNNLLGRQGYAGDLVACTDNTTVTFMPASPDWLVDEYMEMVEFVGSIPPLLTLWENQALRLDQALERSMQSPDDVSVETLHEQERELRDLEQRVRRRLAVLSSPALCRTRGQRQFLDALWEAAGLPRLEGELERRLKLLAERQERIAAMIRRKQQADAERFGHRVQIVLGLIAAASLAGVLQWANDAYDVGGPWWAWSEAVVLIAAAALVLGMYRRMSR